MALKFIIISQENESKADSIVDKQRDLLKTCLVKSRIYEQRTFMLPWCVVCLDSFLVVIEPDHNIGVHQLSMINKTLCVL